MTPEYFYVVEAENELLSNIDPVLRSIDKAFIVSTPFVNGIEANVYLSSIADNMTRRAEGELVKIENPTFFPKTEFDDLTEEWLDGAAVRVMIYGNDDSLLLNGKLMIKSDTMPDAFARTLQ